MSAILTWRVETLFCSTTPIGNMSNVVTAVSWTCLAEENEMMSSVTFKAELGAPGDPFVPYGDLTEAQVLQWVWDSGVNKANVEAQVLADLENKLSPPVVDTPLPW